MNITSSRLNMAHPSTLERTSEAKPPERGDSVTFGGYAEYPPVCVGGAMPVFGLAMNLIGAADADPHGRTDLVHKSLGGALSNLAGTGLLISAFAKGSLVSGLAGAALLGVSGFVAGHVFENMP
jgi:hypothetical protein